MSMSMSMQWQTVSSRPPKPLPQSLSSSDPVIIIPGTFFHSQSTPPPPRITHTQPLATHLQLATEPPSPTCSAFTTSSQSSRKNRRKWGEFLANHIGTSSSPSLQVKMPRLPALRPLHFASSPFAKSFTNNPSTTRYFHATSANMAIKT